MASLTGIEFAGNALVAFCLWDMLERNLTGAYAWRCEPFEIHENPSYVSCNVSIVIATVHPEISLTRCLRLWLANKPKEIILVTTTRDLETVKNLVSPLNQDTSKNHRAQQTRGIEAATGKIILLADDDTFCTSPNVIPSLLAPFENPRIGAVGGKQSADIPLECRNSMRSTPWEAISVYDLDAFHYTATARFGADKGVWVLVGRVQAIRAGILHDPAFLHDFNHETRRGVHIRRGTDTFITRWIMSHRWKIAYQIADEAEVLTTLLSDRAVVGQRVRWFRNSHMYFLSSLLWAPGFLKMGRKHPHMARKMLERVIRPVLMLMHFGVWIATLMAHPRLWLVITAWYAFLYYHSYRGFTEKYPWMRRHVWALFLMDTVGGLLLEIYAWVTINHNAYSKEDGASEGDSNAGAGDMRVKKQ
ncbi:hypothetical protein ACHAQH_004503 [Verticillium albo-atrum]